MAENTWVTGVISPYLYRSYFTSFVRKFYTDKCCGLPGQVPGEEEEGGQIWARQIFDHVKVDVLRM